MADQLDLETVDADYTPTHDLYAVQSWDSTIEIVGYVDAIEATQVVGERGYTIFKFWINNGKNERGQVITWNKEIARVEHLIRISYIVHLDGAYAKPSVNRRFNKGTVDFELVIQSNTIVNILGKHNVASREDENPDLVEIGDATRHTKCIKVQGFIKTRFGRIKKQTGKGDEFICGSITDGEWKMEIHVPTNADDAEDQMANEFDKGEHVEVVGFTQLKANPIHFVMKSMKNMKKIDNEKMKLKNLLQGTKHLERIIDQPVEQVVKKQKLNKE